MMRTNKREAVKADLPALLELYKHLNVDPIPEAEEVTAVWDEILSDKNHHVLLVEADRKPVATCVLLIVPNLTRGARPYAVIENVVTHPGCRKQGFGRVVLDYAWEIAVSRNCYKLMLMSGSKNTSAHSFYENVGFNGTDKKAFIRWNL